MTQDLPQSPSVISDQSVGLLMTGSDGMELADTSTAVTSTPPAGLLTIESDGTEPGNAATAGLKRSASSSSIFVTDDDSADSTSKRAKSTTSFSSAVSSSEVDVETEDHVTGYDADMECLPQLAIYHPSFQAAELMVTKLCDLVPDAYEELRRKHEYENQEVANVCKTLQSCRLPSAHYPNVGPVAVLGPAGSGKSSGLNSIMSQTNLAYEHDGENRGTYVCFEFKAMHPEQTSRYRVLLPYFTADEIEKDVARYFKDVHAHIFDDHDDNDAEGQSEDQAMHQKGETALTYFADVLANREMFQTIDSTREFFGKSGEDEKPEETLAKLKSMVREFLDSRECKVDNNEVYNLEDEDELQRLSKQVSRPGRLRVTKSSKTREASPWPLIQKVVIHQKSKLLASGVVLADTPGINDENLAIVQNTKRYIRNSGNVLIFLSYKRIEQNSPLDSLLRECIQLGKMHNIRLIVTMIDDMKLFSAHDLEELDDGERERLAQAESKLMKLQTSIKDVGAKKKAVRGIDNDQYAMLDETLQKLERETARACASLKQVTIGVRCERIRNMLQGRIKQIEKSKDAPYLEMSFVSNTQYQKHVKGYDPQDPPCLTIEATGIPRLRRYLYGIPAYGKLQNLSGLCENKLPNVLNGVFGILQKSKLERKKELRELIRAHIYKHQDPVNELHSCINSAFDRLVLKAITCHLDELTAKAEDILKKRCDLKPTTFKGVCVRHGEWEKHRVHGDIKWNAELTNVLAEKLMAACNKFNDEVEEFEKNFRVDIDGLFTTLEDKIKDSGAAQGQDMTMFFTFVRGIAKVVIDTMTTKFNHLSKRISTVRHALTLDGSDSFAREAMVDTYDKASLVSMATISAGIQPMTAPDPGVRTRRKRHTKPSVHACRIQVIRNKLLSLQDESSVFKDIRDLARDELEKTLYAWAKDASVVTDTAFDKILQDFDRRFQDADVKVEENPEAVHKLLGAAREAEAILNGPLADLIKECKEYEAENDQ